MENVCLVRCLLILTKYFRNGFRKGYSSQQCLLALLEKWKAVVDKVIVFGVLLTDLSKAFDGINHELLFAKLNAYGFTLPALKLVHDYLSDRKQRTRGGFRGGDLVTCHPLFSDMTLQSQILVIESLFLASVSRFIRKYLLSRQFSYMHSSCSNPAISLVKFSDNFFQEKLSINESSITST